MDTDNAGFNPELAYDLRQIYANIVGEHMRDVADARKSENFYVWLKNLEDLHTIIKHKFKNDKDEEQYKKLVSDLTILANKHAQVWIGQSKDPAPYAEIEKHLRKIEEFLYDKMNDAKMFGEGSRIPGL